MPDAAPGDHRGATCEATRHAPTPSINEVFINYEDMLTAQSTVMQPLGNTTQEAQHELEQTSVAAGSSPGSAVSAWPGSSAHALPGVTTSAGAGLLDADPAVVALRPGSQGRAHQGGRGLHQDQGHAQHHCDRDVPGPAAHLPQLGQPAGRADLVRRLGGPRLRRARASCSTSPTCGPAAARAPASRPRSRSCPPRRTASRSSCRPTTTGGASSTASRRSRSGACRPPTTWDEFIAVCKTIKSKGVAAAEHGHRLHPVGRLRLVRLPQPADQRRRLPPRPAGRQALRSTAPRSRR